MEVDRDERVGRRGKIAALIIVILNTIDLKRVPEVQAT